MGFGRRPGYGETQGCEDESLIEAHDAQAFRLDKGYRAASSQVMREMPSGETLAGRRTHTPQRCGSAKSSVVLLSGTGLGRR